MQIRHINEAKERITESLRLPYKRRNVRGPQIEGGPFLSFVTGEIVATRNAAAEDADVAQHRLHYMGQNSQLLRHPAGRNASTDVMGIHGGSPALSSSRAFDFDNPPNPSPRDRRLVHGHLTLPHLQDGLGRSGQRDDMLPAFLVRRAGNVIVAL